MKGLYEPLLLSTWMAKALDHIENRVPFLLSGAGDAVQDHLTAAIRTLTERPVLVVTPSEIRAKETFEELKYYLGHEVSYFPAKDPLFYGADAKGAAIEADRMKVIRTLAVEPEKAGTLVMSVDAFYDRLVPLTMWKSFSFRKRIGDDLPLDELKKDLVSMGYELVDQMEGPGQFAVRGGIVDIYPVGDDSAYRIELWGDEIDSIRLLDPATQRSTARQEYITVYPAAEILAGDAEVEKGLKRIRLETEQTAAKLLSEGLSEEAERLKGTVDHFLDRMARGKRTGLESFVTMFHDDTVNILGYLPQDMILIFDEPARIKERVRSLQSELENSVKDRLRKGYILPGQTSMFPDFEEIVPAMESFSRVFLCALLASGQDAFRIEDILQINSRSINVIQGSGEMLLDELKTNNHMNYATVLLTESTLRAAKTVSSLNQEDISAYEYTDMEKAPVKGMIAVCRGALGKGFSYPDLGFSIISMQELTEKGKTKRKKKKFKGGVKIDNFSDIAPGDLVVHENHGVGIYQGIVRMQDGDARRDYFKITYKDGGVLYVPTTSLDLLQKYIAMEGQEAKINSLSGTDWERTKRKVREGVAKLAQDLAALYGQRMNSRGHAFGEDTVWQREFEESFPFEETDDQLSAIEATKRDMESGRIMDRLICGDVGFGKTEVAIRAAFKAVQDSKQVAILAPTTILAQQHFNTFSQRMREYPVSVGLLSRFVTPRQEASVLEGMENGTMDIVIGTHKLLGKKVKFKDLGLLVIDEEQRFGVGHKEKIKSLKKDVDVLTLSATPIPRTLHMSLNGMRDMSLLTDAPVDRHPVQTYVLEEDDQMIREAIYRELGRGGQVFYLHNRVDSIDYTLEKIRRLVPEAKVRAAHGQMNERELEKIMVDFVDGELDVLLCTTIIETGLDIPNANTLIVENADTMGLAQLYQLRGRVGRSSRLAYAYFLYRRGKVLTEVAQKRLEAIGELTDFGSGYKISLRDLEIRGAGNVLGPEQHGHMGAVGYDLYCKLLQEAVAKVQGESIPESFETAVHIKVDAFLPADYIRNEQQKLDLYKRIALIRSEDDYRDMIDEIIDRFGDPPRFVTNLLKIALIKSLVNQVGCDTIDYARSLLCLKFREDAPIDIDKLLTYLKERKDDVRVVPEKNRQKLLIRVEHSSKDEELLERIYKEAAAVFELRVSAEEDNDPVKAKDGGGDEK